MSEPPRETYDIVCPHCHKDFAGRLIAGSAPRYRGFKCPHCKLFVPYERALAERPLGEPTIAPAFPPA